MLAELLRAGKQVTAISFDCKQRHSVELQCAIRLANGTCTEHLCLNVPMINGSSSLNTNSIPVDTQGLTPENEIPNTCVPPRNLMFASIALGVMEVRGIDALALGVNTKEYTGYPDCRPEFIEAFHNAAQMAPARFAVDHVNFELLTPLLYDTKASIIKRGICAGAEYENTSSCYAPDEDGKPCRECDSCLLRAAGFKEAGYVDPVAAR